MLKPACVGANGYRYYEEEELLLLQQILFYRKLEIPLKEIQKLLGSNDFDKIGALLTYRELLKETINHSKGLIETIDKTINHIKGKVQMKNEEFYAGFDAAKQEEYEQYLVKYHGTIAEDLIHESKKKTKDWGKADWKGVQDEGEEIYKGLGKCIDQGLKPRDDQVQALIARHLQLMGRFYTVSKDVSMRDFFSSMLNIPTLGGGLKSDIQSLSNLSPKG